MTRRARAFVQSASPSELLRWHSLFHHFAFRQSKPIPKLTPSSDTKARQKTALDEFMNLKKGT